MWCSPLSDAQLFTLPLHLLCLRHQQGSLSFAVESTNSYFCYLGIATGENNVLHADRFPLCHYTVHPEMYLLPVYYYLDSDVCNVSFNVLLSDIHNIFILLLMWFLLSGVLGMLYIPDLQCPHFLSTHINNTGSTSSPQLLTCCTQLYNRWNNMFDPRLFRASVLSISHLAAVIFLSLL